MRSNPIISICIPVYNGELHIKRLLDSLVKEFKYLDLIELVISDNCSEDNTQLIIESYRDKLSIQLFKQEINIGFSKNLQFTGQMAKGEYVTFIGADDRVTSLKNLIKMAGWMKKNKIHFASSNFSIFNLSNRNTRLAKFSDENYVYREGDEKSIGVLWFESALASIGGWVVKNNPEIFKNINESTIYPEYYIGMHSIEQNKSYGVYIDGFYQQLLSNDTNQLANMQYTNIKYFTELNEIRNIFVKKIGCNNLDKEISRKLINNCISLYAYGVTSREIIGMLIKVKGLKYLNLIGFIYINLIIFLPRSILKKILYIYRQ